MPSFLYRGVKVWLDGDMTLDWEWVNKAWLQLQELKSDWNPHEIKFRQLSEHVSVRSYFGKEEIFIRARPGEVEFPEEKFEREVTYPLLYPAIIVWTDLGDNEFEQIGFVTSYSPETLDPPFKLWEVPNAPTVLHDRRLKGGGPEEELEEDKWVVSGDAIVRAIGPMGDHEFQQPYWTVINPYVTGGWAPYPQGTTDLERSPRFVPGAQYEVYLHDITDDDPPAYYWIGRKAGMHYAGWIYTEGICLNDRVEQVWEKLVSCGKIDSQWQTISVPTQEGWFTGHQGLPWANSYYFSDFEYYCVNFQDRGIAAKYYIDKANEEFGDVWTRCWVPSGCQSGDPCSHFGPPYGFTGWWYEFDHDLDPDYASGDGWGWPWIWVDRVCTTLEHGGSIIDAGHGIWHLPRDSVYTTRGIRQPWGGSYLYNYYEWDRRTDVSREFFETIPDQSVFFEGGNGDPIIPLNLAGSDGIPPYPFCLTSIYRDCSCYWERKDPPTVPGCPWYDPCRDGDGNVYSEGEQVKNIYWSHDHLRVDDFEICLSTTKNFYDMKHYWMWPRYHNYGGQTHFTSSMTWHPTSEAGEYDEGPVYLRFDYIKPAEGFISTWISDAIEWRVGTVDGTPGGGPFCEIPGVTYAGKPVLATRGTRLVEITVKVVLEKEEDD